MKAKRGFLIGVGCFLLAALATVLVYQRAVKPQIVINGPMGGEKIGAFEDPAMVKALKDDFGLTVRFKKLGSFDMVLGSTEGYDYLFPSNNFAATLYRANGGESAAIEDAFVSPLVIYSWKPVADALEAEGLVSTIDGVRYIDMRKLVDTVLAGKTWADVGLPELYGPVCVYSTHPAHSNSGNLLVALVSTVLNGGQAVTREDVPALLEDLSSFMSRSGYKEESSSDLFDQYVRTRMGGRTLTALYESQIVEFANLYPADWEQLKNEMCILYPTPTVFSTHSYIALNENGQQLISAFANPEVQDILLAHGFRVGMRAPVFEGISPNVSSLIPMPEAEALTGLLNYFSVSEGRLPVAGSWVPEPETMTYSELVDYYSGDAE